ncbi:hypothetical protein ACU4IU_00110 [Brevibacterium sp. CSND-B09]|uniref:hypothetical protein n=1 Tax=Brevibacterium sp. CSND-B09 TaxID=3462571 RepID=UPI00406A49F7
MRVQNLAYWMNGDGTEVLMDPDLPLQDLKVTREMNGIGRLTASLPPEYGTLTAFANRPVIKDWATALYVEIDGDLFDGFIVVETSDDNDKLVIDAVGFLGYGADQPWPDKGRVFSVGNWPLNSVVGTLWLELQKAPGANINLKTNHASSEGELRQWPRVGNPVWDLLPVPVHPGNKPVNRNGKQPKSPAYPTRPTKGTEKAKKKEWARLLKKYEQDKKDYAAANKAWRAAEDAFRKREREWETRKNKWETDYKERRKQIEDARIKFNYWSTHDILQAFQDLAKEHEFSYRVDHTRSGNTFTHTLYMRPGRLGVRHTGLSLIEGENVYSIPKVTQQGEDRLTSARILGAGDGSKMKYYQASRTAGGAAGLRRARVFADKTLTRNSQMTARAKAMLTLYNDPIEVEEFTVIDHDLLPMRQFDVGDEVFLQTFARRGGNFNRWVTITSLTVEPEKGTVSMKVVPVS